MANFREQFLREARSPLLRLTGMFSGKSGGGTLLLLCTVVALVWANSPWSESYFRIWEIDGGFQAGATGLHKHLIHWVNDGLMAIFFFVVGLEIKRELRVGELASPRQAALPIAAALGGVLFPALIYVAFNAGGPGSAGWGVPMATDIAFAVGIMALLGARAPLGLTVFVTALAIVDDLVAVLVIAVFYTAAIDWYYLGLGAMCLVVLMVLNRIPVRQPVYYGLIGVVLWYAFLKSGVHATVAGVLLAMTIPSRTHINAAEFLTSARRHLERFEHGLKDNAFITSEDQQAAVHGLESVCVSVQPPLHLLEHSLQPWVAYGIMPLFALANAGVRFAGAGNVLHPVSYGIALGLLFGKPFGIFLLSWLTVKLGFAELPAGVSWRHIHGAGWLCGIGFTMSLFIAGLAFEGSDLLNIAKVGILAASALAGLIGSLLLWRAGSARA